MLRGKRYTFDQLRLDEDGLGQEFFHNFGVKPARSTLRRWLIETGGGKKDGYRSCLALCADVSVSLVRKWLSKDPLQYIYVGATHKAIFRAATEALGMPLPRSESEDAKDEVTQGPERLAVFTSLDVVSESYHLAVLRSIIRSADVQGLPVSIHELPWSRPMSGEQVERARQIVQRYAPSVVLLLRLTPTQEFLEAMRFNARPLPVLLVHADRQQYPAPPVLANVVPNHEEMNLRGWLWTEWGTRGGGKNPGKVVLAAMKEEEEPRCADFPSLGSRPRSIRNQRIKAIEKELEGFELIRVQVDDYAFRHARLVWKACEHAFAYVCLSDQIAVGLKHILLCNGYDEKQCSQRIIGYDGTPLAAGEKITSLSQNLDGIGDELLRRLSDFLPEYNAGRAKFPDKAAEISIPVTLSRFREAPGEDSPAPAQD